MNQAKINTSARISIMGIAHSNHRSYLTSTYDMKVPYSLSKHSPMGLDYHHLRVGQLKKITVHYMQYHCGNKKNQLKGNRNEFFFLNLHNDVSQQTKQKCSIKCPQNHQFIVFFFHVMNGRVQQTTNMNHFTICIH